MTSDSPPPRERPAWWRRVAAAAGLLLVFGVSLGASTFAHLRTPVGRALLTDGVNAALRDVFYGSLRLESIEHLGLSAVRVKGVSVWDEQGARLLHISGVSVHLNLPTLLGALLFPSSTERIVQLPHIRAESSEITVSPDAQYGAITLARALTPRPAPPAATARGKSRSTTVLLPSIELGRVVGHLELPVLEMLTPELVNVHGAVQVSETAVVVDVQRFGVRVGGLRAPLHGTAAVQVHTPDKVDVQFSGFLADSEVQSSFAWREGTIETRVSSPRLTKATVTQFLPEWPLTEPLVVSARGSGNLEHLAIDGTLEATSPSQAPSADASHVHVQGQLDIREAIRAEFTTQISDLSLDLLGASWPASAFDAELATTLSYANSALEQRTTGKLLATTIADVPLPETTFAVTTAAQRTELDAKLDEPGAEGKLEATYLANGDLDARLHVPRLPLDTQRRLPRGLRGLASVEASAQMQKGRLNVAANVQATNVEVAGLRAEHLHVTAQTQRAVAHIEQGPIQFNANATQIGYGALAFDRATGRATLNGETLRVELRSNDDDGRQLEASGRFDTTTHQIRDLTLSAQRSDLVGKAVLPLVDPVGPVVEVSALDIQRLACTLSKCPHVTGRGRYAPGQLVAKVDAKDVTLERLWPVLGLTSPISGVVNANIDVNLTGRRDRADLSVEARDISVAGYPKTSIDLNAQLFEDHVDGEVAATNALGIVVGGRAAAALPGTPLDLDNWRKVTGTLALQGELATLEPLRLVANLSGVQTLDGNAHAKLTAQRLTPEGYPTVNAELDVQGLSLVMMTEAGKPLDVQGHRVYVNSTFDAQRSILYTSGLVEDPAGALLRLNGQVPVDTSGAPQIAADAPLLVNGTLEPRDLGALPYLDLPLAGRVSGQLTVYGTFAAPEARARMHLTDLTAAALDDRLPLSVQASAHYAVNSGDVSGEILGVSGAQSVIMGKVEGTVDLDGPDFRGQARVALDAFPLSVVTPLADLEIDGSLTGMVEIADSPNPTLDVQLEVDGLTSSQSSLGRGVLQAHASRGTARAEFNLEHATQGVTVSLSAVSAPDRLPTPKHIESAQARVRARKLNAAVLSPMMSGIVARLNGELDSDVSLEWEKKPDHTWHNRTTGIAHLRKGKAYVEGLGLELQDVTLDVLATPLDARTHIAIDRVQARARSETVNVEGRGQLILNGAELESGSANALFREVPVTLQGLNVGKASGAASAQLQRKDAWDQPGPFFGKPYLLVNATLGNWSLRASSSASRSLIDTAPNPEVKVLQGQITVERGEVVPYRIIIDLGRDTQFALADLDIPLSGETRIDYTDRAVVSGTLTLKRGGRVPILGHVFEVQSGTLRLNPSQPSNPYIDILLAGQAKDGTPVSVAISGTMQAPVVSPPLGQLNELLGGGAATALSGGVQALGLNSLLGDSVQFRVGADENNQDLARYSAAVQIRESLWFEVNYARTETNAFRTDNNNAVSGTLDYRFDDNWSLRTEAGTTGGSVDVVWQYRY